MDKVEILIALPEDLRKKYMEKTQMIGGQNATKISKHIKPMKEVLSKLKYDFNAVNASVDLKELTDKLIDSKVKQYGMLFYGESGSGKSALAEYLACKLGMPFLKKRASDLIGGIVGQTEANIARAFEEARKKGALLVIDEADTFLFDRSKATQMYQVGTTNELLTQMEDHPYPFIMTTNLKDKIDNACFRRFIFKIKFDYMKPENIEACAKTYFNKTLKLTEQEKAELKYLTAGDFKVAKQKMNILENKKYSRANIIKYLKAEQNEKNIIKGSKQIQLGA